MSSAIYNKELAHWYAKRQRSKKIKNFKKNFASYCGQSINVLTFIQILTWVCIASIVYVDIKHIVTPEWFRIAYPIAFLLSALCLFKVHGIFAKIAYGLMSLICGFLSLVAFSLIHSNTIIGLTLMGVVFLIAFVLILAHIIVGFISRVFVSASYGLGGAFGAGIGWNLSQNLFRKKRYCNSAPQILNADGIFHPGEYPIPVFLGCIYSWYGSSSENLFLSVFSS